MLMGGGFKIYKAALWFTSSWGSWGSEVLKPTLALHLPDELNPLLDSFTPLVACSKVGTFSKRPMEWQGMISRAQVAIRDISRIVHPWGRLTMELRPFHLVVRHAWLEVGDLISRLVWRTLWSPGCQLRPGPSTELTIQPHPRGRITFLLSQQGR